MHGLIPVLRRELAGYFITPVAYVFIVIFLILGGIFTFQMGKWFESGQASMTVFFDSHPWLYLFLIPALSMRLWAEERKSGTVELLFTLPVTLPAAVIGKFLAAWIFSIIALSLTFPLWITANYLGDPDNGAILTIESSFVAHIEKDVFNFSIMGEKAGANWEPAAIYKDDATGYMVNQTPGYLPSGSFGDHFAAKMRNFVEHVLYNKPTTAPAEHGLMVQKMLDGIYESAAKGGEVKID